MRPKKVLEAAKYLVSTSELFKSEGIEVHNAWQNTVTTEAEENDEWDQCLNNDNIKKDSDKNTQTIENNNLFYKLKKLQIKQIQDTASISLRKCKTKGKKYTAGDLNSEDYVNKLIHLDEGFRVLKI